MQMSSIRQSMPDILILGRVPSKYRPEIMSNMPPILRL